MSAYRMPWYSLYLLLLALAPTPARAQFEFLDKLSAKVTDIDAAYVVGTPIWNHGLLTDSSSGGLGRLQGVSVEVLFDLGALAKRDKKHCTPDVTSDTTLAEIEVHKGTIGRGNVDSVYKYKFTREESGCELLAAELGIGYSQLSGFRGDALGLQGSIEELPALSLYLSWFPILKSNISAYAGVRTGLTKLKDFRASVGDTLEKGTGSSLQYGLVGGVSVGGKSARWAVFAEIAFTKRTFGGVAWAGDAKGIPSALQDPVRPSTRTLSFGGQISIPQQ